MLEDNAINDAIDSSLLSREIVIVDDYEANVGVISGLLEMLGFENVHEFTDSQAASKFCREHRAELILLDLQMPNMNGFQFIESIKPDYPTLPPILIISASHGEELVQATIDAGALGYIQKPYEFSEVRGKIIELLQNA